MLRVVDRLGSLQFDPLEVTGRNHDLILAARIDGYRRAWTDGHLYDTRALYETYNKGLSIVPTAELPWYRITWDEARARHDEATFDEHGPLAEELLGRIREAGPLASTDIESRAAIDWYWGPTNQVRAVLEALAEAGVLGLSRRDGNRRVYDLAERLFPPPLLADRRSQTEQRRHKLLSRYRAHGLLGRSGSGELWYGTTGTPSRRELLDGLVDDGTLVPVTVEGVRGDRFVLADELPILAASTDRDPAVPQGVAFLAPLDPLVWDRDLLRSLFDFDYVWEVYVPAAKRRWGYYVLPILFGDRLVGRIEPRIDRQTRTLRVLDLWWETGFDPTVEDGFAVAFGEALVAHARFLGADRLILPRMARHRRLAAAVRARLAPGGRIRG